MIALLLQYRGLVAREARCIVADGIFVNTVSVSVAVIDGDNGLGNRNRMGPRITKLPFTRPISSIRLTKTAITILDLLILMLLILVLLLIFLLLFVLNNIHT